MTKQRDCGTSLLGRKLLVRLTTVAPYGLQISVQMERLLRLAVKIH
jgi:hypothetical protein